ncbi:type ISP restriction/modification enzyme [uncultured Helicobacter sp.]|uniref:type ISP restriction/modification enzyme n=1 Tax=uncultured Helicobacter sp. TaxID=175537 RepID=UPI003752060D
MSRNIALNIARQSKLAGSWQYVIVTDTIVDLCLMGGGNTGAGQIFPLYLYNTERARKILCKI